MTNQAPELPDTDEDRECEPEWDADRYYNHKYGDN